MSGTLPPQVLRQLAFIKYIHQSAVKQSEQPEPLCSLSLLQFDDAIEAFLHLAKLHLNIKCKDNNLMVLFDTISEKISLTQGESIRQLHKSRNQLKHNGIKPSKIDLNAFRSTANDFFNQNCSGLFGVDFDQISLIDLILYKSVKNELELALNNANLNKVEDAMDNLRKSFEILVSEYLSEKGHDPLSIGKSYHYPIIADGSETSRQVEDLRNDFKTLQEAFEVVALGIDYRKYLKFREITPIGFYVMSGDFVADRGGSKKISDFKFGFDFVIESALHLQEFYI